MRSPQLLVPVRATSAYDCFKEVLTHLWTLWELMLLAEPTIVMGTSPLASSDAVLSLVALVSPVRQQLRARREDAAVCSSSATCVNFGCLRCSQVPYSGDFRPYFTIHDADFKIYVNKTKPPANVILGVTNPYFVKALEHWPHTLRVGIDTRYVPVARFLAETRRFLMCWSAARW